MAKKAKKPQEEPKREWTDFEIVPSRYNREILSLHFKEHDLRGSTIIHRMEHDWEAMIKTIKSRNLLVNFEGVHYVPTAILGLVMKLVMDGEDRKIHVRFCNLAPNIQKAFELIGTRGMVEIFKNEREAINAPWKVHHPWWKFWKK